MFYRSAADQKLASLEARISRLENRMVRKAAGFESTIDAIYSKIDKLGPDIAYIASVQLGVEYDPSSISSRYVARTRKEGNTLKFPGMTFIPGTAIQLRSIEELDPNTIEITLSSGMQMRTFQENYSMYSDKHLRVLAGLIVKNAMTML